MKKLIYRFLSYTIDAIVIIIVTNLFVIAIPQLKDRAGDAALYTEDYFKYNEVYSDVIKELESACEDEKLTKEESESLVKQYGEYSKLIEVVEEDKEIKEKDLDELLEKLAEENIDINNKYVYKVNKYSAWSNVVRIVIGIIYLGVVQFFTKGYTLGKKIFKLRTISDNDKPISLIKYIVRAILITEALIIGTDVVFILTNSYKSYLSFNSVMSYVKYFYELAFMICLVARNDQKSIHDLLLHTRVALFDKAGNEVESVVFAEIPQEPVKPQEVKPVKTTTKKTATKKTTKKEKEVVKAEKIK